MPARVLICIPVCAPHATYAYPNGSRHRAPPASPGDPAAATGGLRAVAAAGPLLAVSTRDVTLIIAMLPDIRVVRARARMHNRIRPPVRALRTSVRHVTEYMLVCISLFRRCTGGGGRMPSRRLTYPASGARGGAWRYAFAYCAVCISEQRLLRQVGARACGGARRHATRGGGGGGASACRCGSAWRYAFPHARPN